MISLKEIEEQDDDDSVNEGLPIASRFRSNLIEDNIVVPGSSLDSVSAMNDEGEPQPPHPSAQSQELEQKYLFALETVRQLRHRLIRRTSVIEEIRKFYLRDVITMKHILKDVLSNSEREAAWKQYEANLPSLDLKQALTLHAPSKCEFQVKPCEHCGGELELVMKDTDEVDYLKKLIKEGKDREARWREKLAYLDVQIETANKEKAEANKSHMEEKRVLYAEMKKLKDEIDRVKIENSSVIRANKKMKEEHDEFMSKNADLFLATGKLAQAEKELDILKVNMEETQEALRMTRSNEKAQQRELNTTKAEVKDLKITIEKGKYDYNNMAQEKQQLSSHLERIKEAYEVTEKNLVSTTQLNLDLNKRIRDLEEELKEAVARHEVEMHDASKQIDSLKFEMKELQQTQKSQNDVKVQLETALTVAQEEINQLQEIKKSQELELLESAEEIEQFEEEIASMQQFIRESLGAHDDSEEDDSDTEEDGEDGEDGSKRKKKKKGVKLNGFRSAVVGAAATIKLKREQRKQHRRHAVSQSTSGIIGSLSKEEGTDHGIDVDHDADDDSLAGHLEKASSLALTDAPLVVGEPRKTAITYAAKRKGTMRKSMRPKRNDPLLGLPIDPEDMVCVNQPSRFDGIPDEKIVARKASIIRRRSEPKLFVFRSASSSSSLRSLGAPHSGSGDACLTPPHVLGTAEEDASVGKARLKGVRTRLDELRRMFERPLVQTERRLGDDVFVNATKVNFKVKQNTVPKEAPVALESPPDGATPLELWFRAKLLDAIKTSNYYTENACHRVMNIASPLIHSICLTHDRTCSALWDGLQLGKRGLDFYQKMQIVCEGIITCGQEGITNGDIAQTCAVIVPIAGSSLNTNVTTQWQQAAEVKDEIIYDLMPMIINYDTGERRVRPYSEFFAPPEVKDPNFNSRVELAEESIRKMADYSAGMNTKLAEYLVEVLREWSSAKTVFIDLESRIEAEKDKIRRAMDAKVAAIGKELSRQQQLHEKNLEKIRALEKKMQEYAKMEIEYHMCQEKLDAAELQVKELKLQLSELKVVHDALIEEGEQKSSEILSLGSTISQLQDNLKELESHCESVTKISQELSAALQSMTEEKESYQYKYEHMMDREDARLNRLFSVECQYEPSVTDAEIQTEFIVPPMDLKTVVVNKLSKSGIKKYPMVFSQSLDYLPADDTEVVASIATVGVVGSRHGSRPSSSSSRPESEFGSGRGVSRGASRGRAGSRGNSAFGGSTIADLTLKDGPVDPPRETLEDFFDLQDEKLRDARENPELKELLKRADSKPFLPIDVSSNQQYQSTPQFPANFVPTSSFKAAPQHILHNQAQTVAMNPQFPFINSLTSGLLSRQGSVDSLSLNLSDFKASPPIIGYENHRDHGFGSTSESLASKIDQLPSRQMSYEEHARYHSNAGLSKIGIANLPFLQNLPTASTGNDLYSPRSVGSKDSISTNASSTTAKGLKKGTSLKRSKDIVLHGLDESSGNMAQPQLEVPVQSYKSPSKIDRDLYSVASNEVESPPLSDHARHAGSLRNNVSNAHQEIVNGIVYNYRSNNDQGFFRTEAAKAMEKEEEIAQLREPITIKSYASSRAQAKISSGANIFASSLPKPRQATTPPHAQKLARGKTPMVMDDTLLDTPKQPPSGRPMMSSSLSQAGLATLNSDTMKKMQKELLHR